MDERTGTVEAIYLAAEHGAMPRLVDRAVGHPGKGLEGDRHFGDPDAGDITLIEAEAFERQLETQGLDLEPRAARRQVVVRGIDLGELIGQKFQVGELECEGEERCEPCNHLAGMVGTQAVLKGLLHTGLVARIITGGTIRAGDSVRLIRPVALP